MDISSLFQKPGLLPNFWAQPAILARFLPSISSQKHLAEGRQLQGRSQDAVTDGAPLLCPEIQGSLKPFWFKWSTVLRCAPYKTPFFFSAFFPFLPTTSQLHTLMSAIKVLCHSLAWLGWKHRQEKPNLHFQSIRLHGPHL